MADKMVDIMLVTGDYSKMYLSGFQSSMYYIVLTPNKDYLITDFRYMTAAKDLADIFEVKLVDYNCSVYDILEAYSSQQLGIEESHMTAEMYLKIKDIFNDNICLTKDFITRIRSEKDANEIENIKVAESIGDEAFEYILGELKADVTEFEIANKLEQFMKSKGASKMSFDPIVAFGENSTKNHAVPSDRKLKDGDMILMDFGCIYQGYCSDMTRTVGFGNISDFQKEIYGIVLEAQQAVLDHIKAGLICKEVDEIARKIIIDKGYGEHFGHGLGHGTGLEIHEEPYLNPRTSLELKANQVVTVEPGIYIPDQFGVRIEDMVVVTDSGHINLTHSPKELIII